MKDNDINSLRQEFDELIKERCISDRPEDEPSEESEDDENIPHYIEQLQKNLLAPALSGVYLTRIDIKRIADDLDESLPIKERKKMLRNLMRHITTKETLREVFDVTQRYINGRILIFEELSEAFPASREMFEQNIKKAKQTITMFDRIVEDFEEIEVTDDPMVI